MLILAGGLSCLLVACGETTDDQNQASYRLKVLETYTGSTLTARAVYSYDSSKRLARVDTYKSAGANKVWGDADDELDRYSVCNYNTSNKQGFFDLTAEYGWPVALPNPVNGKTPACADGVVAKDSLVQESLYSAPGPTGWNKGADVREAAYSLHQSSGGSQWIWDAGGGNTASRFHTHGFYANGRLKTLYVSQGNAFKGFYQYSYQGDGRLSKRELFTDASGDGISNDDPLERYEQIGYPSNTRTDICTYAWNGSAYVAAGAVRDFYGDVGLGEERTATATGGDGRWCTSDDVFDKSQKFVYEQFN